MQKESYSGAQAVDASACAGEGGSAQPKPEVSTVSSVGAYYPWLDALRGLSWVFVMVGHTMPHTYLARMGVGIFFAISGWLITQIILKQMESKWSLSDFYARRWLRIIPLYYLLIVVTCLSSYFLPNWQEALSYPPGATVMANHREVGVVSQEAAGSQPGSALMEKGHPVARVPVDLQTGHIPEHTLLSRLLTFGGGGGQMIGHCWSLCVEERYYVFWPLILTLFAFNRKGQRLLIIGIIAFCCLATFTFYKPNLTVMLWAVPFPLLLGSALAIFWPKVRSVVPFYVTAPLATVMLTLYILHARNGDGPTINTLGLMAGLLATGLVASAVFSRGVPSNPVTKLFQFLGPLSYGAYLFHVPFAIIGRKVALWLGVVNVGSVPVSFIFIAPLVGVALLAPFAYLLHHSIELPILNRRKVVESRVWLRRTVAVMQVVPILVGMILFFPWKTLLNWVLLVARLG